jgi:agmatine deiminase
MNARSGSPALDRGVEGVAALGYRLPAEWEPQAAVWMAWPHRRATWVGDFAAVPPAFERLVRQVARHAPVRVLASGAVLAEARRCLGDAVGPEATARVSLVELPTSDAWLRDTGPVWLAGAADVPTAAVCWRWNAWGGKYPPWDDDARVARWITCHEGRRVFSGPLVLEGGAIETDGEGTVIANHRCIVDPLRNPGCSRDEVAGVLCHFTGTAKVVWIGGELAGDDTDGHVDQLARFVAPGRVVAARQPDRLDPNHESLEENLRLLAGVTDARGRRLEVIPLDIPAHFGHAGTQLPASHLNYLVCNGVVIVPVFGGPSDEPALRTIADCFPDHRIEPCPAEVLVRGRGAVHCLTCNEPA